MFAFFLAPPNQPFAIASLVLIGLVVLEGVCLLFGAGLSELLDSVLHGHAKEIESDHDHLGPFGTALDWLNAGRVPLLVLIMAWLAAFAATGFLLQALAAGIVMLPATIAALVSFLASIPLTRRTSRVVARIIPRDESYVVDDDHFIGRTAVVTLGPLAVDSPGRAKVQDAHGNWHFPRVRRAEPGADIPQGASVLIVSRQGQDYSVLPADPRLVSPSS